MKNLKPLIKVENLYHTYMKGTPFEKLALQGVNLEVYKGEVVGIIGHTGAGKTTLIQHFNALLLPQKGKVMFEGEDLSGKNVDIKSVRKKVGVIFQYAERQLFKDKVANDIAFGPKQYGLSNVDIIESVKWAMEMVELNYEKFKDRYTFSLSGGEMRRVAIAGILALRPKVLVLDESTTGLDPQGKKYFIKRIKDWHENEGLTIVFVSPNMEDIAQLVDRVYVMNKGKIIMSGTTREVFSNRQTLLKHNLEVPQVTEVMHELKEYEKSLNTEVLTVSEAEKEIKRVLIKK